MASFDDTDSTITSTPLGARVSKTPGRSYSDVRERFARRQYRKLEEERLKNVQQALHLPNQLTRSSAFMSPIIQATLKRARETSNNTSALISPTSVTHAPPREAHVVVVEDRNKCEQQETETDDQKALSPYPILCTTHNDERAVPRLRGLQGCGSLLDSAILISSCGKRGDDEERLFPSNRQTSQYFPTNKCYFSEERALQQTSHLVCKTDANTKKFAYNTIVDAGLLLGRTITDCTVLSKDIYRLNSSKAHRQRDDDLNFFLHESGTYDEALDITLQSSEPLLRSRSNVRALEVDRPNAFQQTPSHPEKVFHTSPDSSSFSQLLSSVNSGDIPLLPREITFKTEGSYQQCSDKPSWQMDDEQKTTSIRAISGQHQDGVRSIRGLDIRLNPKSTTGALRLASKPKLHDDFDLHLDAQRWRLDDQSDDKNSTSESVRFTTSLKADPERGELARGFETSASSEQTPTVSEKSKMIFDDAMGSCDHDFAPEAHGYDNTANVSTEFASLRGEVWKLRAQIAEARAARFVTETDKIQAMLDRDRYRAEVDELKTWVTKVKDQEREIRDQVFSSTNAREAEADRLRIEISEVRSFLEQKKLTGMES